MMDLFRNASHDQIALAFCAAALLVSGTVMYFSHHVGQLNSRIRLQRVPNADQCHVHPQVPVGTRLGETGKHEKAA